MINDGHTSYVVQACVMNVKRLPSNLRSAQSAKFEYRQPTATTESGVDRGYG